MHEGARRAIARFYFDNREYLDGTKVADVGSLNINGAVKDVIPHCVGFDIVEGDGVDVIIEPGIIPEEHQKQYGAVIASSSFAYCADPYLYRRQLTDLLVPGGLLLLITCSVKCAVEHSTSNNKYGFKDWIRMEFRGFEKFFATEFEILELAEINYGHQDYVLVGKLRG